MAADIIIRDKPRGLMIMWGFDDDVGPSVLRCLTCPLMADMLGTSLPG